MQRLEIASATVAVIAAEPVIEMTPVMKTMSQTK
jgi:hypothetical protein